MTARDFEALKARKGWEYLAARAWGLRHCEAGVLGLLVFNAGHVFSLAQIGASENWHGRISGSANGVRKRVERVRSKLADVGLVQSIETIPGEGYAIPVWLAKRIDGALKFACGVEVAA